MSVVDNALRRLIQDAVRSELGDVVRRVADLAASLQSSGSDLPIFLTANEVAELTKVRPQTVRSWVSSGVLPAHYAGRKLRVRLDELEAFMQRGRDQPVPSDSNDDDRVREILTSINE